MELSIATAIIEKIEKVLGVQLQVDIDFYAWLFWLWWPFILVSNSSVEHHPLEEDLSLISDDL